MLKDYKPNWRRIIFLSLLANFFVVIFAGRFFISEENFLEEDLEINFVDVNLEENFEVTEEKISDAEQFPEIKLPPIEIPKIPEVSPPKIHEKNSEKIQEEVSDDKPKIIAKVFPKDIFQTLMMSGLIQERPILREGKVLIAVTVNAKGKVSKVKILSGNTGLIKIVSEAAASAWIFDTKKNPQEFQTQIEFTPEDF